MRGSCPWRATSSGATVALSDGSSVAVDGFLVRGRFEQAAPFAEQLGLTLLSSGCIEVDVFGRTSRAGVYAAGDLAHSAALPMPMASVLQAAAAGQLAASAAIMDLMTAPGLLRERWPPTSGVVAVGAERAPPEGRAASSHSACRLPYACSSVDFGHPSGMPAGRSGQPPGTHRPRGEFRRAVAQLVELRSPKPAVGGSSPSCPA